MKKLFNKYFQSVLSPDEFDLICDYIEKRENTLSISGFMKSEWDHYLSDEMYNRKNLELLKDIQQQIISEERIVATKKLKFYNIALRVAAVLLIGAIVTSIWFYNESRLAFENIPIQTVCIPDGARTQLAMPDGSKVWLNSGSKIIYSSDFSEKRNVELVGEAFFDVVKGKIPFEVKTNYGTVHVMGTAFNVLAYPDGRFVTTLERGVVKVTDRNNKKQEVIAPGEQVQLVNKKFIKSKVNIELFTSWKDGKLIFSRDPFPDMILRLERWYNVKIDFSPKDFDGLWFTATIEGETLTDVMEMICKAAPVKYSYNSQERKIVITPKNK